MWTVPAHESRRRRRAVGGGHGAAERFDNIAARGAQREVPAAPVHPPAAVGALAALDPDDAVHAVDPGALGGFKFVVVADGESGLGHVILVWLKRHRAAMGRTVRYSSVMRY
jgi:hypothetical protein